jgi:predicted  nucleic acid-binding Zn-ribbon protein
MSDLADTIRERLAKLLVDFDNADRRIIELEQRNSELERQIKELKVKLDEATKQIALANEEEWQREERDAFWRD